jgi:hypothetical protein
MIYKIIEISDCELGRGKPIPSTIHSAIQMNLAVALKLLLGKYLTSIQSLLLSLIAKISHLTFLEGKISDTATSLVIEQDKIF